MSSMPLTRRKAAIEDLANEPEAVFNSKQMLRTLGLKPISEESLSMSVVKTEPADKAFMDATAIKKEIYEGSDEAVSVFVRRKRSWLHNALQSPAPQQVILEPTQITDTICCMDSTKFCNTSATAAPVKDGHLSPSARFGSNENKDDTSYIRSWVWCSRCKFAVTVSETAYQRFRSHALIEHATFIARCIKCNKDFHTMADFVGHTVYHRQSFEDALKHAYSEIFERRVEGNAVIKACIGDISAGNWHACEVCTFPFRTLDQTKRHYLIEHSTSECEKRPGLESNNTSESDIDKTLVENLSQRFVLSVTRRLKSNTQSARNKRKLDEVQAVNGTCLTGGRKTVAPLLIKKVASKHMVEHHKDILVCGIKGKSNSVNSDSDAETAVIKITPVDILKRNLAQYSA